MTFTIDTGLEAARPHMEWVWDHVRDRLTVTPPDGLICIHADCAATTPEGGIGRVVIFDFVGF